MFLEISDLGSAVYDYQLNQITEGDDAKIETGIATAIEEVRSYITANNQTAWKDGRFLYDEEAIFNAVGTDRNPLIMAHTKTAAVWHIIQLCNAEIMYEHAKERYDRSILWLRDLASGKVSLSTLPRLTPDENNVAGASNTRFGGRTKFNYE